MQLTVVARTIGGFAILLVLLLVLAGVAFTTQNSMNEQQLFTQNTISPMQSEAAKLSQLLLKANKSAMQHLSIRDAAQRQQVEQELKTTETEFNQIAEQAKERYTQYPQLLSSFEQANALAQQAFVLEHQQEEHHNKQLLAHAKVLSALQKFKEDWGFFKGDADDLSWDLSGDENSSDRFALQFMTQIAAEYSSEANASLAVANINDFKASISLQKDRYDNMVMTTENLGNAKEVIMDRMADYLTVMNNSLNQDGNLYTSLESYLQLSDEALQIVAQLNETVNQADQSFQALDIIVEELASATHIKSKQSSETATMILAIIVVISVFIALIVGWTTVQRIRRPMNVILGSLEKMASGDLSIALKMDSQDEFGQIATQVNTLKEKLVSIVQNLNEVSGKVTEVAEQATDITHRTQQQIELQRKESDSVATAIAEMDASATEVASNAQAALDEVESMNAVALDNRQSIDNNLESTNNLDNEMKKANEALVVLEKEVDGIGAIVQTIQEITGQTNLLALNAAIEAARAGAHGRGFAVVADEVRSLATRTQSATKEIEELVESLHRSAKTTVSSMQSNQKETQTMVNHASVMGDSFVGLQEAISRVRQSSTQISSAAHEQTSVAHELNTNISRIVDMAGNIAKESQTSAERSETLLGLANRQKDLVGEFKL
ncbi:methyl-accepting chemotaxis protein [Alginatibacterium sediminis]|uniref:Methyl-accepting chemotaxis protein n=1 Tax=Alginatibacterium sediminis TaxID=2164068 RepID=A0A420EDQ8_9ALTE|nr:methyl-accepting chemotaxis protein [Alginatibacterium sediminis]RKF18869.1 methyl-accepting chemotaxis protein [Alginatibacterium sediminis]